MSTRGVIGIRQDGKFHGTYNHADSYPEGLGAEVVKFVKETLSSPARIEDFRAKCRLVEWVDGRKRAPKELQERYSEAGFSNTSVSTGKLSEWYCLLREVQGVRTFEEIAAGRLQHVPIGADSPTEEEYGYVLNLDEGTLEFYAAKFVGAVTFGDTAGWERFFNEGEES